MYATESNEQFFNALTGVNKKLIERSIVALYEVNYGNSFTFSDEIDRNEAKQIILKAINGFNWQIDDETESIKKDDDKASYILRKLQSCGWVAFVTNRSKSTRYFSFTKYGKKFSQLLHSLQDEDIDLTQQRNVRSTKALLESYRKDNDPRDLIDAVNASKDIISDLTDNINDIKEEKNLLMAKAMESIDDAGEKFIEFLDNRFAHDFAIKFGEDSADRHQFEIRNIINAVFQENDEQLNRRMDKLKKHFPTFVKRNPSFKNILSLIKERMVNACEAKLPTMRKEIQSYISRGGIIFKQTNALLMHENKNLYKLASIIKSKKDEKKDEVLNGFASIVSPVKISLFDTNSIRIKNKTKRQKKDTYLNEDNKVSYETIVNSIFEKKLHEAFSYTPFEQKDYIIKHLEEQHVFSSKNFTINTPKDMLLALYSIDYVSKNPEKYEIEKTDKVEKNLYFETEEYIINRKK